MHRKQKFALAQRELVDGWDALDDSHHGAEGLRHHLLKHAVAHLIRDAGREVGVEVKTRDGEIDVLDMGRSDEGALAIEIETAHSPEKVDSKVAQYESDLIRDVVVLPAREAPTEIDALEMWIKEYVSI